MKRPVLIKIYFLCLRIQTNENVFNDLKLSTACKLLDILQRLRISNNKSSTTTGTLQSEHGHSSLVNCSLDDLDVVCLYIDSRAHNGHYGQQNLCHQFIEDLRSFSSNKTASQVMFAAVVDRFSATKEVNLDLNAWHLLSSLAPEPYGLMERNAKVRRYKTTENITKKLHFIQRLFSEMGGVRVNASQMAVLFLDGTGLSYEEIRSVTDIVQQQGAHVKVFVVVMYVDFVLDTMLLNDTLLLPLGNNEFSKRVLTLAICRQCMEGWLSFGHIDSNDGLSCYRLMDSNITETWQTSQSTCVNDHGGSLVAIESEEELDFLRGKIFSDLPLLDFESDDCGGLVGCKQVYIGLYRDSLSVTSRFKWNWIRQPLYRPLVINNWNHGKPSDGHISGCVMWHFVRADRTSGDTIFPNFKTNFSDGWTDIECNKEYSSFGLCEVAYPHRIESKNLKKINPANRESFSQVLAKEDFIEFEGNIVSVSANVASTDFVKFYKQANHELFPVFDCGQDAGNPRFIAYVYVCDGVDHCSNRRDEGKCSFDSGDITSERIVEENLKKCIGVTCCDGSCLPLQFVNDGEVDCAVCDYTGNMINDEQVISNYFLDLNETCAFICNRDVCVHWSQLNDGEVDCYEPDGPLDETIGKLEVADTCYNKLGPATWAPKCVYVRDMYGNVMGCRDMSHVKNCSEFSCSEGYFKCPNTYCIPQHYVLDGTVDCPRGEDEQFGNIEDCTGNFACWDSKMCLHPDLVCDGHPDCPRGDDEDGCWVTCMAGFRCISGTVTVSDYNKSIPLEDIDFLETEYKYLDLSGLDLSVVGKDFPYYLVSTLFITWSNCGIASLSEMLGYFSQWVQEMDASFNLIQNLDGSEIEFLNLQNIRVLNLSYNKELVDVLYLQFNFLEVLDLSHTGLSRVDESALAWLPRLNYLDLSYTNIKHFCSGSFPSHFVLEILNLRGLYVENVYGDLFNGLTINQHLYTDSFELCCPHVRGTNIPSSLCHTNDGSISSCTDLIGVDVQRVLLWVVAVLALLFNVTVVFYRAFWERSAIRTGYGLFVANLGMSDCIMGAYLFIIAGADCYYRGVYVLHNKDWKESGICQFAGFLATFSSESSRLFIFLITMDRYLVMKFPFGQVKFSTFSKTLIVLIAWAISFCVALTPIVFRYDIYSSNVMCLGLPLSKKRMKGWKFSFSVFIVFNFLLSIIIAYGQIAIYRAMAENRISRVLPSTTYRRADDIMVAKQLSLVALSNFLCWFPVGVMGIMPLCGYEISNDVYSWTTVIVLPMGSAANPLLYTIPALLAKWEKFKRGNRQPQQYSN